MDIEFDDEKSANCREKRGFGFEIAERFEAVVVEHDTRSDYGEARFRAFGFIDGKKFCLAFTPRHGRVRVISLRQMHDKEARKYGF
ncbi:MAG: BrnT family toxin [Hyphomicrobiaceae bacterium]|nr:BrnT family toxin [Hyphomicrobiaceae bacterium]